MDTVLTKEYPDGYSVEIFQVHEVECNPREWDNLGVIYLWHRNYNFGDKNNAGDPKELLQEFKDQKAVVLPVFMYDHSGITINTVGYHCPWDSGQVGFIVATRERIREIMEWNRVTKYRRMKIIEALKQEIKTLDQYLTGDVYGFSVEFHGENVDSCFGFFGHESIEEDTGEVWTEYILPAINNHRKERVQNRIKRVKEWIRHNVPLHIRQTQLQKMP